jgi:hypothetical protein
LQRRTHAKLAIALTLVLLAPIAPAQSSFELGNVLTGDTPTSTAPWLTVTFTDALPGQVTLTLLCHLNVPSEFIGEISLNLNPAFDPASLAFLQLSGPSLQGPPSLSKDAIRLPGGGSSGSGFDILLDWPTGHGQDRFDGTEAVSFDITGPANLTWSDFDFYNTVGGQDGEAIIGAHIQGIPLVGGVTGSGAVIQEAPEPAAAAIMTMALMAFALCRTRAASSRRMED